MPPFLIFISFGLTFQYLKVLCDVYKMFTKYSNQFAFVTVHLNWQTIHINHINLAVTKCGEIIKLPTIVTLNDISLILKIVFCKVSAMG